MKIGILGDIHANLAAFNAALDALDAEGCDVLVSTGDLVGYGPSPAECVRIVREREISCVVGNHDHYVTLLMDARLERLKPDIRSVVEWTQSALSMDDLKWLAQLPRRLDFEVLSLVHGAFGPSPWLYLTNEETMARNFEHQDVPLAFCGHSHVPVYSYYPGAELPPHVSFLKSMTVPDLAKIMVNIGSVGQPRDGDPRAACTVYTPESRELKLLRVPYDIAETQELMRQASLPERFITRLEQGK